MALRVVIFTASFIVGLLLSVERQPASAQRPGGTCFEAEGPRSNGLRSFCRRAERLATAPIERQFME